MTKSEHISRRPPPPFFYSGSWPLLVMMLRMSRTFPRYCAFVSLPPLLAWPLTLQLAAPFLFPVFHDKKARPTTEERQKSENAQGRQSKSPFSIPTYRSAPLLSSGRRESNKRSFLRVTFSNVVQQCKFRRTLYTSFSTRAVCQCWTLLSCAWWRWRRRGFCNTMVQCCSFLGLQIKCHNSLFI